MRKTVEGSDVTNGAEANQFFRISGSGKPYLRFNTNSQICDCNELFVTHFKISKEDLLATNLTENARNKQFVESVRKTAIEGLSTFHGKVVFGVGLSEVYLEASLINVSSQNPDENGIFCFILYTTLPAFDTKPALESLNLLAAMPGYPNASVSVHTPDGTAIYISPSTEAMLGYSKAEIKELGSLNLVYPDDLPLVKKAIEKLNSGVDFLNTRYRMVHKNGSVLLVETTSYILGDASGNTNHIVNITWDLGSHQGMEQALKFSEQKYYRLVMNLPVGVSLISKNGQLLEVNDSMKKIMRLNADLSIMEFNFLSIEAMKRSGISAQFSKSIDNQEIINGEIQFKLSGESYETYLAYSFVPILDHSGNVESVIGYVNDLTQLKKAETDYHERADFLKLVINSIKTPFFVKDEDHKWVVLNNAAVEMMGQAREALLGKSDYDLFPETQADVFWKYDEMVFRTGSSSNEEQITWSDGTVHTIVTYKQLYVEKPSGKKFIVGTIHDITSYKKIEEELRASGAKYHELFDNANDFILTTDIDGKITNANRTLLRYLQTDLESLTQHNVFEFVHEENIDFANDIKSKILEGECDTPFELKAYGIDRQPVVYEVKASLIQKNGQTEGVQCVFSDVTLRKEASLKLEKYNASLLELNKTRDKFFRIIAHDLRNPYSSIIGFTDMLLEDLEILSKDGIKESLEIILNVAKNSFNLLDNLLSWSRLQTGHIPFDPVRIALIDAVEEVVNVLFSSAYRKKIDISNHVKPDVVLLADKYMLITILNNLIMNAIKFTNIGGRISIYSEAFISETEAETDFVKISVADNGVGMDAETCKNLFALNRMVSAPGTEREQGTGLGLLLTREMVEKNGGTITVESSPGKGSVFSFLIPVYSLEGDA